MFCVCRDFNYNLSSVIRRFRVFHNAVVAHVADSCTLQHTPSIENRHYSEISPYFWLKGFSIIVTPDHSLGFSIKFSSLPDPNHNTREMLLKRKVKCQGE